MGTVVATGGASHLVKFEDGETRQVKASKLTRVASAEPQAPVDPYLVSILHSQGKTINDPLPLGPIARTTKPFRDASTDAREELAARRADPDRLRERRAHLARGAQRARDKASAPPPLPPASGGSGYRASSYGSGSYGQYGGQHDAGGFLSGLVGFKPSAASQVSTGKSFPVGSLVYSTKHNKTGTVVGEGPSATSGDSTYVRFPGSGKPEPVPNRHLTPD
jgi:hypothetical protein